MRANMRFVVIGELVAEKHHVAVHHGEHGRVHHGEASRNGREAFLGNHFTNHSKLYIGTHLLVNACTIAIEHFCPISTGGEHSQLESREIASKSRILTQVESSRGKVYSCTVT